MKAAMSIETSPIRFVEMEGTVIIGFFVQFFLARSVLALQILCIISLPDPG